MRLFNSPPQGGWPCPQVGGLGVVPQMNANLSIVTAPSVVLSCPIADILTIMSASTQCHDNFLNLLLTVPPFSPSYGNNSITGYQRAGRGHDLPQGRGRVVPTGYSKVPPCMIYVTRSIGYVPLPVSRISDVTISGIPMRAWQYPVEPICMPSSVYLATAISA